MAVWRADRMESVLRQAARPPAAPVRGAESPRFALEAEARKPAAASLRRTTPAPAPDRARDAAANAAESRQVRSPSSDRPKPAGAARATPEPGSSAQMSTRRDRPAAGSERMPARAMADPATPSARSSERARPEDGEALQGKVAQEAASQQVAAAMISDTEAESGSEETPPASDEEAAAADPALLPAPLLSAPPPSVSVAASAGPTGAAASASAGSPAAVASPAAGALVPAASAAASQVEPVSLPAEARKAGTESVAGADAQAVPTAPADGKAGFDALLAGMQGGTETAPTPTSPVAAPSGTAGLQGAAPMQGTQTSASQPAAPATPPVPLGAVAMTIGLRSLAGVNRFAIRLDPVELGRIDVSLDLDKTSGRARAHLVVDRPETLALLQRDAGSLQQALAQAGFDLASDAGGTGIDLSLRGEGGGGRQDEPSSRGRPEGLPGGRDEISALDLVPLRPLRALGALDIRI